jgi:hypothetical protein
MSAGDPKVCPICGGAIYGEFHLHNLHIDYAPDVSHRYHPEITPYPPFPTGWQCPICKQVYAPFITKCENCRKIT